MVGNKIQQGIDKLLGKEDFGAKLYTAENLGILEGLQKKYDKEQHAPLSDIEVTSPRDANTLYDKVRTQMKDLLGVQVKRPKLTLGSLPIKAKHLDKKEKIVRSVLDTLRHDHREILGWTLVDAINQGRKSPRDISPKSLLINVGIHIGSRSYLKQHAAGTKSLSGIYVKHGPADIVAFFMAHELTHDVHYRTSGQHISTFIPPLLLIQRQLTIEEGLADYVATKTMLSMDSQLHGYAQLHRKHAIQHVLGLERQLEKPTSLYNEGQCLMEIGVEKFGPKFIDNVLHGDYEELQRI